MKKKMMMMAALGAVLLTACEPVESEKKTETGALAVMVGQNLETKAVSTTAQTFESKLNKLRLLVYDASGSLYKDEEVASPFTSHTIPNVKAGTYSVCAVANTCAAISDVTTLTKLTGTVVKLSDCSTTESTGFAMYAQADGVSVSGGSSATPVSLAVTRFPARVKLMSVKNSLPASLGALTVENVMLINGYSQWALGASGNPTGAMNPAGRKSNGAGDIIASASDVNEATYSFKAVPSGDQTLANGSAAKSYGYYFYSFPNLVQTDVTGAKQTGGKARLVVTASFNGNRYYYPVTIPLLERNKCYEVTIIVSGAGSDDPNVPVTKGSMSVNITVSDWVAGGDYTETI